MKEENRIYKIDNIKCLLIFLVVLAHSLYSYTYTNSNCSLNIVYFIYSFHMPIFCIISGLLSKKEIKKEKLFNLFILFFIMNTSFYLYDYFTFNEISLPLVRYSSWYILDLLFWRYIYSKTSNSKSFIMLSLLLGLSLPFVSNLNDYFNIYRFVYYLFFFLVGTSFNIDNIKKIKRNNWSVIGSVLLIIISLFVVINYDFDLSFFTISHYSNIIDLLWRILFLLLTFAIFYLLILFIPNKSYPIVTKIGRNSLNIYFFHRIITLIFNNYFYDNKLLLLFSIILSIIICLIFSMNLFNKVINIIYKLFHNVWTWIFIIFLGVIINFILVIP